MKKRLAVFVILSVVLTGLSSWGFPVRRTVNQLAIYQLRGDLRAFFYQNKAYLVQNAPRPDIRRNTDSTEATRHFIDLEIFGDSAAWKMPMNWNDAVAICTKDTLLKYGHVPYVIMHLQERLTESFRQKNKDSILFYAADIGHYIGDVNVPLHTSVNYDGQLTDQKGLHSLWESMVPEIEISGYDLSSKHKAKFLHHPEVSVWTAIRRSHVLLADVFGKEKEVSKQFTETTKFRTQVRRGKEVKSYTSEFAKAYSEALKPTINQQLKYSADMIADFWYTAWVNAGKPDMEDINTNFNREAKKQLKKETRSYKKNQLINDSLLISKKPFTSTGSE